MLKFVKRYFESAFEIILWLCLIASVISGAIIGNSMGNPYESRVTYVILGIIVGAIIGAILVIIGGGLIANFLSISRNVSKLASQLIEYRIKKEINLRTEPDLNSNIITKLKKDSKVIFILSGKMHTDGGVEAPWFKVQDENGNTGWCFSGYLE